MNLEAFSWSRPSSVSARSRISARSRRRVAPGTWVYWASKRLFDILGSTILLVVLSPVLLAIAIAIFLDDGLLIVYRGERAGRYGQPITVLKFRTMRDGHQYLEELLTADEEHRLQYKRNRKLKEDPRRTRVGVFRVARRSMSCRNC